MFSQRLDQLIRVLHTNSSELAEYSGFDRSNISRMRNGRRTPLPDGSASKKLISGICLLAERKGRQDLLLKLCGASPEVSGKELYQTVSDWLFEEENNNLLSADPALKQSERSRSASRDLPESVLNPFSRRFNAVIDLAELSNVRLSQLVNVDPSLISRYRSGSRSPRSNPKLARLLVQTLYQRIVKSGRQNELARLMRFPADELDESRLFDWMLDMDKVSENSASAAEKLLETFDSYSVPETPQIPAGPIPGKEAIDRTKEVYEGYEGLQEAVIRFLCEAIQSGAKELLLYSDQNMDWLLEYPEFRKKWAFLMSRCVNAGIRIRIIHNVDRDLNEMNAAIISWLPLYISGQIESFYSVRPGGKRFSHTLFLCPGKACICSWHVVGHEKNGKYQYQTSEKDLDACSEDFRTLMESCKPLVKLIPYREKPLPARNTILIQKTLSFASMSEQTALNLLSGADMAEYRLQHSAFEKLLKQYEIHECITLADPFELLSGSIHVDLPSGSPKITYTPEQYAMQIRDLLSLLKNEPNYHLIILPEIPFRKIKILMGEESVVISRGEKPFLSMAFTHPLMCHAFQSYAERLIRQYTTDRSALIRQLENRYLPSLQE